MSKVESQNPEGFILNLKREMFKIIEGFRIKLDEREILRLLGHTSKSNDIKESSKKIIQEMIKSSTRLIAPKGIYTVKSSKRLPGRCLFELAEKVVLCICTIGEELENEVKELSKKGEPGRAVVLDTIGSVAAESTAGFINQVIKEQSFKENLYCSTRFSPGYGGWNLEGQKLIFDILPTEKIGVSLNQSFMMMPRKSVSFAVNLARIPFKNSSTPCETCGLKECRFKEANEKEEV